MLPEQRVSEYRTLLSNDIYKSRLVSLTIDEAHCVVKWYSTGQKSSCFHTVKLEYYETTHLPFCFYKRSICTKLKRKLFISLIVFFAFTSMHVGGARHLRAR